MKGIVFTEFLEMVEDHFGSDIADQIIEESNVPSGGAYTAVGTYDHAEIIQLVDQLSIVTGLPVPDLLRTFGRHLFGRFYSVYPQMFEGVESAFAFLHRIEVIVHVEVRKLYPDAELPTFECQADGDNSLTMIYRSTRPFGDFAEGLILGCADHFGEKLEISREDLSSGSETCIRFNLQRLS